MKKHLKEVQIGLVAVVALVALYLGINFLKGKNFFSDTTIYYMSFENINGLTISNPIYASGYKVGRVKKIDFDYSRQGKIIVQVEINSEMKIPVGSTAAISSDVLGNIKVNLLMASNHGQYINAGEVIPGMIDMGTVGVVSHMVPTMQKMLPKLDSIMTNLNVLLANPSLAKSLDNIGDITTTLSASSHQLHSILLQVNSTMPHMLSKANKVLDNSEKFTHNLSKVDVLSTMAQVNATVADVDATVANVKTFTAKLNNNSSSLGLLLQDTNLYLNLNKTVQHIDSLVVNLRQHPKRYVHFSLFGKK